jgi:hypothetical protein
MIVELGDGQVAGLPPSVSAMEFYRMLIAGTPAQITSSIHAQRGRFADSAGRKTCRPRIRPERAIRACRQVLALLFVPLVSEALPHRKLRPLVVALVRRISRK